MGTCEGKMTLDCHDGPKVVTSVLTEGGKGRLSMDWSSHFSVALNIFKISKVARKNPRGKNLMSLDFMLLVFP
jgi:hypothetical protein